MIGGVPAVRMGGMEILSDTAPEAQRVLSAAYRAMTPARKLRLLEQEFRLARSLHEAGLRRINPGAGRAEVRESWNAMMLGLDLWNAIKQDVPMDRDAEPLDVLRAVVAAFERLGIGYAVGGSLASSLYGEARYTRDADIAVEPFPGLERALAGGFGGEYYVSVDAITAAVRGRSAFNIIHTPSAFKVDIFVVTDEGFERSLMARRAPAPGSEAEAHPLVWVSAEDIVLLKLRGFRLGNEVSERQWLDVLGVVRTQADRLDSAYLDHWAGELGVRDLWERARGA